MTLGKKTKKLLNMKKVIEFLFGRRADAVCQIKLGVHTVHPKFTKPYDYGDWCKEFRVSTMHGKQIVHLN